MRIYSVFDKVAGDFNGIFLAKNHPTAVRAFKTGSQAVRLEDYELHFLGEFNIETGAISSANEVVKLTEYELEDATVPEHKVPIVRPPVTRGGRRF